MANDNEPGGRKPPAAGRIDERAILREGEEARRELGFQMARKASTDPASLDPKRLRRLGQEGMVSFLAELRGELPKLGRRNAGPSSPPKPIARRETGSGKAGPPTRPKTAPLDGVRGWWKRPPEPPFEQTAMQEGFILGAFLIVGLVYALLLSGR